MYLQYDGRRPRPTGPPGRDLIRLKEAAVDRLSAAGVFTTLTMTTALGVNDDEIGAVVGRASDTPYVGGVTHPARFGSGRSSGIDPMDRLTHTGVLARLGPQTGGLVQWRDLTALPCSHPHCCSVGYLIRDDAGGGARWPRSSVTTISRSTSASSATASATGDWPHRCATWSSSRSSGCANPGSNPQEMDMSGSGLWFSRFAASGEGWLPLAAFGSTACVFVAMGTVPDAGPEAATPTRAHTSEVHPAAGAALPGPADADARSLSRDGAERRGVSP